MKRFTLSKAVQVCGRDFLGRSTSVLLHPIKKEGWHWLVGDTQVPIDWRVASVLKNRITLLYNSTKLHVYEHLGALRYTGLDSVLIVSESEWLPYDGSGSIFWDAVKPYLVEDGAIPFVQVDKSFPWSGIAPRVAYQSSSEVGGLRLNGHINYKGIGSYHTEWNIETDADIMELIPVKTQGWPKYRRTVARVASTFGWPHMKNVTWPQEHDDGTTLDLFLKHRMYDMLGALSLARPPDQLLGGDYYSFCAGHTHDFSLVCRLGEALALQTASSLE